MSESRNIWVAALVSLLLHALLLGLAGEGSPGKTVLALSDSQDATQSLKGEAVTISVLLVSDEGEAPATPPDAFVDLEQADGSVTSTAVADVTESVPEHKLPNNRTDPADSAPASPAERGPAARHSGPLDNYRAQILGRIERAWVRPLAHVREAFRCEARITQTPQGEVREVTLTHCDADPVWRASLTRAIRYAAPLPAPPSETEFRPVLTLSFRSQPLSPALLAELLSVADEVNAAAQPNVGIDPTERAAPIRDARSTDFDTQ